MTTNNDDLDVRIRVLDARTAVLQAEQVQKSLRKIGREGARGGKEATSAFTNMERGAHRLRHAIAFSAGAAGIGGLVFGIRDAIHAATEWQVQQQQLQNALRNTGQASEKNTKLLEDAARRSSTHGGFKAQEEVGGIAQFVRLTHSATKAVSLNTEAVDLARGRGIAYAEAVRIVSQAQTGNTGRLQKILGIIQPVTYYTRSLTAAQKKQNPELYRHAQLLDKQATAAMANKRIMDSFGHATQTYGKTAAGAISNAQHSFELFSEEIGTVLLPYVAEAAKWLAALGQTIVQHWPEARAEINKLIAEVKEIIGFFRRHMDLTKALAAGLGVLVVAIVAVKVATLAWTKAQMALNFVMALNPIELVIIAIAALVAAVVYCYLHFKTFRNVVNAVFHWLKTAARDVVHFVSKHWKLLVLILAGPLAPILAIVTHLKQVKKLVSSITSLPGKAIHGIGHIFGFAAGGIVPGYASGGVAGRGSDTVPAMLTPGEGILTRAAVQAIGGPAGVHALNQGGGMPDLNLTLPIKLVMADQGMRIIAEGVTHYTLKRAARR